MNRIIIKRTVMETGNGSDSKNTNKYLSSVIISIYPFFK